MSPVQYRQGDFPPADLDWPRLIPLIGPANAAVARYDGLLSGIPNPDILLSPLMTQEAVLSSKIEGTQATMGEVLEFEADGDEQAFTVEKRGDIEEILNYRKAMRIAEERIGSLPLSQRIIKEAHKALLQGVRGHGKSPGAYRKIPNWIGPPGCTIEEARYVPVSAGDLPEAMGNWEKYIHVQAPDALVQLGLLHAEFEALHPFLDGNGRLGRMFVPLFLSQKGLLSRPMFYISGYLERNRELYYERLLGVSRDGDWTGWVAFFLESVLHQARENQSKAEAIRGLYDETVRRIAGISHSRFAVHAADFLFRRPLFRAADFYLDAEMTPASARRILNLLKKQGFFREIRPARGRKSAVLAYRELLNLAEGGEVF